MSLLEKAEKKSGILNRFKPYMGKKVSLLYLSLVLSALSAVLNVLPFFYVWKVARSVLQSGGGVDADLAVRYAVTAFVLLAAALVIYFAALTVSHLAAFHAEVSIQKKGMEKIIRKPLGYFDEYSTGKIRKVINDGAGTTHTFLAHQLPDMAGVVVSPVIILVMMIAVEWRMGLASLVPLGLGVLVLSVMMSGKKGREFQALYLNSLEEMSSESVEYVRGIPVVKTFGQSVFSSKRFYESIVKYRDMVTKYTISWCVPMSFYLVIMQSVAFVLIPLLLFMIGRGGNIGLVLSDFIFYLLAAPVFSSAAMKSAQFSHYSLTAEQELDRIDAILDYEELHFADKAKSDEVEKKSKNNDIEFKSVAFAYKGSEQRAVDGISFTLKEGERVALVGQSGSGKTTIARLVARFWDCDEGEILLGGVNIKEIPKKELMNRISFVFQNTKLFKGSLRDNIKFGNENASDEVLQDAVKMSQSEDIIQEAANGLDTVIGSKGTWLSGGQQQRISLARAFVKDAPIVLLDEATAFADPENEHLMQKAIKELSRGKTTLIIAHRLTGITDADKILVLNKGKIAETGKHAELLGKSGLYKEMWDEYRSSVSWKIK